jgi:hypothetical protein
MARPIWSGYLKLSLSGQLTSNKMAALRAPAERPGWGFSFAAHVRQLEDTRRLQVGRP